MLAPRLAVLLAAGLGTRLGGKPKPLLRVAGRPLAWYPLSVLHLAGAREACIVTRSEIADELRGLASSIYGGGSVTVVVNPEPERENGYSLLLAATECPLLVSEPAYVSMTDHIYSPLIPVRAGYSVQTGYYMIAGDSEPCCIDIDEATFVKAVLPRGYDVGKGIAWWTHVDTGVHVYALDSSELQAVAAGEYTVKLNTITSRLAQRGRLLVADVSCLPWTEIDTPRDLEEAERGQRRWVIRHVEEWLRS
ncbi:NTP transferase domain-containing protein [Hyperthermus butylicus]|uniref:Sugar nucleotidyltransferase n=1 Tax=Hyperthermus butylicus (strain DSM 5456 / JCM 9403 / PLM1-5) TaxID=415426 RepID=A2BJ61_HYPBU|nr:NTP transferase domain-containing protein [Hyperthermus butylicus]ABM80022.1 putative sugar nucleotidyltransferase [Hyperthermus butylicus DSM 5456]